MLRLLAAASVVAALSTAAFAAEPPAGPQVVGDGDNLEIQYPAQSTNVVGSALSRVTGPGGMYSFEVVRVDRTQPAGMARPIDESLVVSSAS